MSNKIAMLLMNQKGYFVLSEFVKYYPSHLIESVISHPDPAVKNDYYLEIKTLCAQHHIPYYDKTDSYTTTADYQFAIGWRWVIQSQKKLIIFHDSLLPKYRGFNPLVTALINGDSEIGVTALFASHQYDAGEIILQREVNINYPIKIQQAIEQINVVYFNLVKSLTDSIIRNETLASYPQDASQITYSLWRDELDYHINWHEDAAVIKRFIDAVGYPYLGAYTLVENEKLRILSVDVIEDIEIANRTPGKVIFLNDGFPVVVCGRGLIRITSITDTNHQSKLPLDKFRVRFT